MGALPILLSHRLDSQNVLRFGGAAANPRVREASVALMTALLRIRGRGSIVCDVKCV